ncbi:zinc finger and BTB domain-containing protein 17-like [Lytechinus variegatus]|uniref:zinc finger and BTB domain-containing protein 17-like n=1 Tax=Lytechinus variegatus TaxID=7654 RepID=UPI001BB167AC|nr:zinc finger and BTB domain-containing protein 17-like [Lytechinus variegatus]
MAYHDAVPKEQLETPNNSTHHHNTQLANMEPKQELKEWDRAAGALDLSIKKPTSPRLKYSGEDGDTTAGEEKPLLGELSSGREKSVSPENVEVDLKVKFLPKVNNFTAHKGQSGDLVSPGCDGGSAVDVAACPLPELPVEDNVESTLKDGTEYAERDNNLSSAMSVGPDVLRHHHADSPCPQVTESTPPALPVEDSTTPCNLKVEPSSPSPQATDHASHGSPIQDSTFPEVVPKTDPGSPTPPTDRTSSSTSSTDHSPGPSCTSSTNASPVPSRPYSSMLPILSIPKVRLRQNRSEGQLSWTHVPSDSPSLNVGGYFLDGRGGSTSGEQSGLDPMDYSSKSLSMSAESGTDDPLLRPSLLQMALQHGSTQVNMPATSQALEEQMELRRTGSSVGTCPTLPINPKNSGKAKPRTKTREKRYYQCEHCNIIYEQPRKLERHLQDLVGKPPYVCCYCDMAFPTLGCKRFHSRLHEDKTMPCPYCPKVFHERRRYDDHVRSHTGEAPFMCQECGNVYRTRSALRIHKRTHGNDKPLQCRFCPKRFIRIGDVQVHERTHTGEKPYKCGICESSFATSSQVNRHRRTHSEERPHQCSYCNKTFKNPDYLITHEKMHLGHKPHHCKYCPKQFRTPRELVHHERVHTGEKPFECKECGHRFSKKTNLKQHELQHTGIKSFKCSKCPKSFYRKASLMWHEKIHENRERFLCKECGKLFFKESSRDKHVRKAHGKDEGSESGNGDGDVLEEDDGEEGELQDTEGGESSREKTPDTYPRAASREKRTPSKVQNDGTDSTCEECGKTFLARRSLLRHYRAIHNRYISRNGEGDSPGTKPKKSFSCRICSETFLTDHLRHVHEGTHTNASFTCETCSKTFSTRQLLVKHQKIHSDVKPHVCETCGSAFTIKWYLNRHINIVHSDVYSHTCSICDKKFKSKTALSVHMQLHNVEGKVYRCDQCDAEFHVKRYLARHKRKYHRGKDSAKTARRANTKHKEDYDDDDDDDPMYDFDDNMDDDGFDVMNDDSQAVSGVFLRQMLSKGSDLDDFNKSSKTLNNHDHSDLEDTTNTLNNHESDSNSVPKVDSDHDGSSFKKVPSKDQDIDQEHQLMQSSADIASTSKDISFNFTPEDDDAEPFVDREDNHDDDGGDDDEYDGAFSLDDDEMSDYV